MKKHENFEWTLEAQLAFEELKKYLTSPLVLVAPELEETLQLYISATTYVVSMVLVVERTQAGSIIKFNTQSIS